MAYQTVTTRSYGQRVGDSFKGIGTGFLMFIAGTCLLWWNEGRTVKTDDMLNEAQANTEIVESVAKVNPDLEGKLIHATAKAETTDSISDPDYPVGGVAINIRRSVEYYQWVEHEKTEKRDKLGGGEETIHTYTYEKKWVSSRERDLRRLQVPRFLRAQHQRQQACHGAGAGQHRHRA